MTPLKPVIRLKDPIVVDDGDGMTFAKLLAVAEYMKFDLNKCDSIDVVAAPVTERPLLNYPEFPEG